MAKKCKCPPGGAPGWVMTFGDLMCLLLTFFVLLLSLSEIKKDDEFRAIVKEVKQAFGMRGGGGRVPTRDNPELSFIERIRAMRLVSRRTPKKSNAEDPGMDGHHSQVENVRPGQMQATGGRVTFEPGKDQLAAPFRKSLLQLADRLRGHDTKIHVSGHADTGEPLDASPFGNLWELSLARAMEVVDYMVGDQCRINPMRIKIIGNGDSEKLRHDVYLPPELRSNRRVEIFVSDVLIDDLRKPEMNTSF